jgi:hypothetical protein
MEAEMTKTDLEWLMTGPSWLRYAVERQLKGVPSDTGLVMSDPAVKQIIESLKQPSVGLPAILRGDASSEDPWSVYWRLFFLADIGLTARLTGLEAEFERVLAHQTPEGAYVTERNMPANYFCVSAILLYSIARMGYARDQRVLRYLETILCSQRFDGGWHCEKSQSGTDDWGDNRSCPMDNLNVLLLLSVYPEYLEDKRLNGAIDLLLHHWRGHQGGLRIEGFGVGRRYQMLTYPAVRYGALRVLDALYRYPYALKQDSFRNLLQFVQNKAVDGRYYSEGPFREPPLIDFQQGAKPSRWVTFVVSRIEQALP